MYILNLSLSGRTCSTWLWIWQTSSSVKVTFKKETSYLQTFAIWYYKISSLSDIMDIIATNWRIFRDMQGLSDVFVLQQLEKTSLQKNTECRMTLIAKGYDLINLSTKFLKNQTYYIMRHKRNHCELYQQNNWPF